VAFGGAVGTAHAQTAADGSPYPFPDLSGKTITFVDYGGAAAVAMRPRQTSSWLVMRFSLCVSIGTQS